MTTLGAIALGLDEYDSELIHLSHLSAGGSGRSPIGCWR